VVMVVQPAGVNVFLWLQYDMLCCRSVVVEGMTRTNIATYSMTNKDITDNKLVHNFRCRAHILK